MYRRLCARKTDDESASYSDLERMVGVFGKELPSCQEAPKDSCTSIDFMLLNQTTISLLRTRGYNDADPPFFGVEWKAAPTG